MSGLRLAAAFLLVVSLVAACSTTEPEAVASIPATPSTTTSTTTTTTASAPPMTVTGVPAELARLVASVYEHAADVGDSPVDAALLPVRGIGRGMAGRTAVGGTGRLGDVDIAFVGAGPDLIAAVDDGTGWRVVAVDLPSLDHRNLGFESAVVAVVGSDARPGEDPLRARADSLHLIGFDGVRASFDIVGIPRDSWVSVPGHGFAKITSSLALGGPSTLRATLEGLAGYPLNGMAIAGFEGFQEALGNVLGGVQITLDAPITDAAAGADFPAGDQYMNGPDALAFARARKSLVLGDIDRQRNGGSILIAAAFTARHRPVEDTARLLAGAAEWGWTDLDPTLLVRLAATVRTAPPLTARNEVLAGVPGERGASSTIELTPAAHAMLADLADGSLDG
ncbi:MAG: LCP family protein [Acidimicrobiia bacterium]